MKHMLAVLFATLLLLAACGDSDDPRTAEGQSGDAIGADDANGPAADASSASTSDWCQGAIESQAEVDKLEASDLTVQEQFRARFETLLPGQLALLRAAPGPISGDAGELANGLETLAALLAAVDYNVFALDEADAALLEDATLEAAGGAVDDYVLEVCGLDAQPEGSETASATVRLSDAEIDALLSGPLRDEILGSLGDLGIGDDEAECVMRVALGSGVDVLGAVDEGLLELLTNCGVTLEELAAIGLGTDQDGVREQLRALTSAFTPEFQEALKVSEEARTALAGLLVDQGFTQEASDCAVKTLAELEDLSVLDDVEVLVGLFLDCGVSLTDLAALG